jgi:predicted nucleic acid-binding protein
MMRVFLDVNVSLDIVVDTRRPFHDEAKYLIDSADIHAIKLMVSAANIATMIYQVNNKYKITGANDLIWNLLERCDIVNAYKSTMSTAFSSDFHDKEDASEYFTALDNHADYFLTRDLKDYKKSISTILPVLSPVQFKDIIDDHTIFAPAPYPLQ